MARTREMLFYWQMTVCEVQQRSALLERNRRGAPRTFPRQLAIRREEGTRPDHVDACVLHADAR